VLLAVFGAGVFNELGVFDGGGAQDDALDAGLEQFMYRLQITDAAAELRWNQYGPGNIGDDFDVLDGALSGAVEVNDVESGCPQRLPLQGGFYRVFGEHRFAVIVALIKADTSAAADIYGRDDFRSNSPTS